MNIPLTDAEYTPDKLLEFVRERLDVRNQYEIAHELDFDVNLVGLYRRKKRPITSGFLMRVLYALPDVDLQTLLDLAGIKKPFSF